MILVSNDLLSNHLKNLTFRIGSLSSEIIQHITIVGIYFQDESDDYEFFPTTFISEALYNKLNETFINFEEYNLYIPLTRSYSKDYKLLKSLDMYFYNYQVDKPNTYLRFANEIVDNLSDYESHVYMINRILTILSISFGIIAFIMIFNYFSSSVVDEYKYVGILCALGATRKDLLKIYISRSLFLIIVTLGISFIGILVFIPIINNILMDKYVLLFPLLSFGFNTLFSNILLSLITVLLSSIFPIYKITKLTPIDAIKIL
jgi:ABC-type antimicrobial peptide transport system permease subunit